jgi:hypothetical protein
MATPKKTAFDVGQRVRLTTTCDGLHPDGETAVRVNPGELVEITAHLSGNNYHAKYAQRVGTNWGWGSVRLNFADAQTVLGRQLFPGPLDRDLGVRPQDQGNGPTLNASGQGSTAAKDELHAHGKGDAPSPETSDEEGDGTGGGKADPAAEKDPQDMTTQELYDELQDAGAGSPQDSAETTSDDETDDMTDDQKHAADALAKALQQMGTPPAATPPQQQDATLEQRVATLERLDSTMTTPVRDAFPSVAKQVSAIGAILTGPLATFMGTTGATLDEVKKDMAAIQAALVEAVKDAAKAAAAAAPAAGEPVIHVFQTPTQTFQTEKGDRPEIVESLFRIGCGIKNIQWVGPAGCGKTTMAAIIATRLGLEVGDATCSPGMSETIWTGRLVPNIATGVDNYRVSLFAHLFEHGGVFLADEMDNSDPASLLAINTALANSYFTLPDGRRIVRHADFVMISAMNTYGNGADRVYVGRAQLDGASKDRYKGGVITVGYDPTIERAICGGVGNKNDAKRLYAAVVALRKAASKAGIREIISTRWIVSCSKLMAGGRTLAEAMRICAEDWSENDRLACGIADTAPAAVEAEVEPTF